MSKSPFEHRVDLWLSEDFNVWQRFGRNALGLYHNKLPREFRLVGLTHWLSRTALASSAPGLAYFYGSIPGWTAIVAGGGFFLAHSLVGVLDKLSKAKSSDDNDVQSEMIIRVGDLLSSLKSRIAKSSDKDDAIRACLGIIENYARTVTKSKKGDLSVSLVLFSGNSTTRMKVRHRNPGNNRPTNREFDGRSLLGFHACGSGPAPRVVQDLKWFGKPALVSPTQQKVGYRSILIVPVQSSGTAGAIRGFVSIDCARPYAFYGNRSNVIMVTCEPVFSHINELI
ncbi:hypothetical protein J1C56_08950 [Aminobacter anthyllidis]|uniref:Uncharacterized protein n=1 Tax=Aminobacter anthyllidis TaxID=1035067 RepID=A0A9X1D5J3_9HYPH|nr:hypothetical protein [Aminobacter anthyllidis]MBT1155718.1 hypothetical protein [Aminobacter anthyllidis]